MSTREVRSLDTPEYVGNSLSFGRIGEVLLVCHAPRTPTPQDWLASLARLAGHDYRAILISTRGGDPLPAQRNSLFDALRGRAPRLAVLSVTRTPGWAHAGVCFVLGLDARVLPFDHVRAAAHFLACPAHAAELTRARRRAHVLLERRARERLAS